MKKKLTEIHSTKKKMSIHCGLKLDVSSTNILGPEIKVTNHQVSETK
jgi:hypothetical protein